MYLKDNTKYFSKENDLEKFMAFQNVANKKISDLLNDKGCNILVYPYSFYQCEDEIGKQHLLSMQTYWKGNQCSRAILDVGNVAGFFSINGEQITISSRFSEVKDDLFLHYMLCRVLCMNVVDLWHKTTKDAVFNFLIYIFPKLLIDALAQGLYKEYKGMACNDRNIRGNIDIKRQLKTNVPFNGRIACNTRELSYDNHVTELLRHTIEYIAQQEIGGPLLTKDETIRFCVAQIKSSTPGYSKRDRGVVIKSNLKNIYHPYYSNYIPLQKLCLRILSQEKSKYGNDNDNVYGILFDVSYLWEEYLASILQEQGFKHPQNRKQIGYVYLAEHNFKRYPDFYREIDHTVIDAKYKRKVERNDIHQIITYMYRLKGKRAMFIQPMAGVARKGNTYNLLGYGVEESAILQNYYFSIPQNCGDFVSFTKQMKKVEDDFIQQIHLA